MSVRISPTRIRLFRECRKKWWHSEVEGRAVSAPHHRLGTYVHEIAENLLVGRSNPYDVHCTEADESLDWELIETQGELCAHLTEEALDSIDDVEQEYDAGWYKARIDCLGQRDGMAVVVDHKTSADPRRWAKGPEQLAQDLQCQMYCWAVMERFELNEVLAHWHWVSSRKIYVDPVVTEVILTREQLQAPIEAARQETLRMQELEEKGETPLPVYGDHCYAFGGCPYKVECMTERSQESWLEEYSDI